MSDKQDSRFTFDIAICYQALGRDMDVRRVVQTLKATIRDSQFYIGLAKLYQTQGKETEMWHLINQMRRMGKSDMIRRSGLPLDKDNPAQTRSVSPSIRAASVRRSVGPMSTRQQKKVRRMKEKLTRDVQLRSYYDEMLELQGAVDVGAPEAAIEWEERAAELFDDFRSQILFYPRDKTTKFTGFNKWKRTVTLPEGEDMIEEEEREEEVPSFYRGIHFDDWMDSLMRLALQYAKDGSKERCWDVLDATQSANVFAHDPFRIQAVRNVGLGVWLRSPSPLGFDMLIENQRVH